ncbi:hypothetical protein JR316_0002103 [Psilocybe cubensis]|uniref:Uncharacterized protein n=2 Tax=Psilocybe cubensis TaxID=181762 RepID=A0ACB8HB81_PSICU|nr:hypothetical protein JR316_0002103 [Psilocybe cubensis]KAH9485196.1 hypothetical protein JR316_0002103 [Psilocybe cubensis]
MFSRCHLASRISKSASTSLLDGAPVKSIPRATKKRTCSVNFNSARRHSDVATSYRAASPTQNIDIEWPSDSWDDIFNELDKVPLKPRTSSFSPRRHDSLYPSRPAPRHPSPHFLSPQPTQRQTLTKREQDTLSEMVDWILKPEPEPSTTNDTQASESSQVAPSSKADDLVSRLRRFSRKARMSISPSTELLDKKKEEMSLCTTDQELLSWAAKEVFGQSAELEEQASMAIATQSGHIESSHLQSPIYPEMVAHLMQTFRVQFGDPNLALYIFDHTKRLSTLSFVFGCSTNAYNELLETQWLLSRDLNIIYNSIEEMIINGVVPNARTRKLVDTFRRQVSEEISSETLLQKRMECLLKIEHLLSPPKQPKGKAFDEWKSGLGHLEEGEEDFNDWTPKKITRDQHSNRNKFRSRILAHN